MPFIVLSGNVISLVKQLLFKENIFFIVTSGIVARIIYNKD